jgi:hypothetical protein
MTDIIVYEIVLVAGRVGCNLQTIGKIHQDGGIIPQVAFALEAATYAVCI